MAKGLYYGGEIEVSPEEVLTQQGLMFRSTHREIAIADNGSLDILIEVLSAANVKFEFNATGLFEGSFLDVGSLRVSADIVSLDVWNQNVFFQAANSGDQSTKISHTASYAVATNRGDFMVGGGGNKQAPLAGKGEASMILSPGNYAFQLQNLSGGAADLQFTMVWDEPFIPNIP